MGDRLLTLGGTAVLTAWDTWHSTALDLFLPFSLDDTNDKSQARVAGSSGDLPASYRREDQSGRLKPGVTISIRDSCP